MFAAGKTLANLCASVGWLLPAYLCIYALLQWCQLEVVPMVQGLERQVHSFPFLDFAHTMLVTAIVWLGIVLVCRTAVHARSAKAAGRLA